MQLTSDNDFTNAVSLPTFPLTIIIRRHKEVTIYSFGDCSQRVAGLKGVVPIVDVSRVLEGQTAL